MKPINPLDTIQKHHKLNTVSVCDSPHPTNNGHHEYRIDMGVEYFEIEFQNGPRNEPGSKPGVMNEDLLEIVRHRLQSFQAGPYSTRENAVALTHIEEALLWLNKRVEDRAAREVLGTHTL